MTYIGKEGFVSIGLTDKEIESLAGGAIVVMDLSGYAGGYEIHIYPKEDEGCRASVEGFMGKPEPPLGSCEVV